MKWWVSVHILNDKTIFHVRIKLLVKSAKESEERKDFLIRIGLNDGLL